MSIWQTKKWQEMLQKSGQVSGFFDISPPSNSPLAGGESILVEKRKVSM